MSRTSVVSFLLAALLLSAVPLPAGQAAGGSSPKSAKAAKDTRSAKQIDVCALLTSAEIEAVQGESIKETKPNMQPSSTFLMLECFFRTATFAKSISLALAAPDPAKSSALTPREYWKKQFHPSEQAETEKHEPVAGKAKIPKETEEEREKELSKPRPIEGLGEEAYWVGNAITGALYVLEGDAFLRISIGGVREESARIEKSKVLARAAFKRL
jgi:hypothetical protein